MRVRVIGKLDYDMGVVFTPQFTVAAGYNLSGKSVSFSLSTQADPDTVLFRVTSGGGAITISSQTVSVSLAPTTASEASEQSAVTLASLFSTPGKSLDFAFDFYTTSNGPSVADYRIRGTMIARRKRGE